MTKKSVGRLQRDAEAKERKRLLDNEMKDNRNWDDLHEQYANCNTLLLSSAGVGQVITEHGLLPYIENQKLLDDNIRLLTRDIGSLHAELKQIYGQHSAKRGGATEEDVMQGFAVYELYVLWIERYNALIPPTVNHILEMTGEAGRKKDEAEKATAAEQAADPNHTAPIDVQFTEVPATAAQQD